MSILLQIDHKIPLEELEVKLKKKNFLKSNLIFLISDRSWSFVLLGSKSCWRSSCYSVNIYTYNRSLNFTISSWLRDENGLIVHRRINAHDRLKPVLQFVAIQRRDTKQWALPGVRFQNK